MAAERRIQNYLSDSIGDDLMADIGRLSRLQQDLQREHKLLHDALAAMADAVITTDHLGRVNYFNAAAARLVEHPHEQVMGHPLKDILRLRVGGLPILIPTSSAALTTNWRIPESAVLVDSTGEERPISGNITPIRDAHGEIPQGWDG